MSFGALGTLGSFNRLGAGGDRLTGFIPGAALDLRYDRSRYFLNGGVYGAAESVPNLSFTRSGARTATGSDGTVYDYATGVRRIVPGDGLRVTAGAVNKCQTPPENSALVTLAADSTALREAMGGTLNYDVGAGALFGVVDASALIEAAGLSQIAPNGRAWVVDNRAGSGPAIINFSGVVGNTNDHNFSAWAWQDAGVAGEVRIGQNAAGSSLGIVTSATPERVDVTQTPSDSTRQLQLYVKAGARGYLIAPQITETSGVVDYIPGLSGASASAGADEETFDLGLSGGVWTNLGGLDPADGVTFVLKIRDWVWGGSTEHILGLGASTDKRLIVFRRFDGDLVLRVDSAAGTDAAIFGKAIDAPQSGPINLAFSASAGGLSVSLNGSSPVGGTASDFSTVGGGTLYFNASNVGVAGVSSAWVERAAIKAGVSSAAQLQALTS